MTAHTVGWARILPVVFLGAVGTACQKGSTAASSAAPSPELVATTGSEPVVLRPDGRLLSWDTKGKKRWELETEARPNEHRIAVAPSGLIYLRTDKELLAINGEGTKQWSVPIVAAPAGQFGGVVVRMDSAALVVDATGELVCVGPDSKLAWRMRPPKPITLPPVAALSSVLFAYAEDEVTGISPDGKAAW